MKALCLDNGGLNRAFSILSSNGSVTCRTFTENSRKQLSLDTLERSCENSQDAAMIKSLGGSSATKRAV